MNSQFWLTRCLIQNCWKIWLLKCLKTLESCLFRQGSEFLSVGQCPSWATWDVRVGPLQDAPRGSWGYRRTKTEQQLDSWSGEIAHPDPKPTFSKGPAGAEARHHHPSHPTLFPQELPHTPRSPPRSIPPLWLPSGRSGSFWQNLWHRFRVLLS